jgi:hypothetical protein
MGQDEVSQTAVERRQDLPLCRECGDPIHHEASVPEGANYCLPCRADRGLGLRQCWFCGSEANLTPLACADPPWVCRPCYVGVCFFCGREGVEPGQDMPPERWFSISTARGRESVCPQCAATVHIDRVL